MFSFTRLLARTERIVPLRRYFTQDLGSVSTFEPLKNSPFSPYQRSTSAFSSVPAASDDAPCPKSDPTSFIRNFAIIAHVDHGKTTLLDKLISECAQKRVEEERLMDHNALESERGITISSKYTSLKYGSYKLNAVDTPGHADFGGEVERVLGMVDGALLLVDALEGPLAQTKFVVAKALAQGIKPILLLNKVDRPSVTQARCEEVESELFDLFAMQGASDDQLDFQTLYASAREGVCTSSFQKTRDLLAAKEAGTLGDQGGMTELINAIIEHTPHPEGSPDDELRLLVTMIERDQFMGRLCTGRVASGTVRVGDRIKAIACTATAQDTKDGAKHKEDGKVSKIFTREGLTKTPVEEAVAGDIVCVAGLGSATVTDTIAGMEVREPLESNPIDPPTIKMAFAVNDSPLNGREGDKVTGSKLLERLVAEAESNVSIQVIDADGQLEVHGRGELQLGVLIETMRREGYEMQISPPRVLYRQQEGRRQEPIEEVVIEVEDKFTGSVIEALTNRKGDLVEMMPDAGEGGRTRLVFLCPSRGLIGYRGIFATLTSGSGILHRSFHSYDKYRGDLDRVRKGVLVSMAAGAATGNALMSLEARGVLFVGPQTECYPGMIIGENSRDGDMEVNPCKAKKLTNMRSSGADEAVKLAPPRRMSLEEAMGYVQEGEVIEVTPKNIRLRKMHSEKERLRMQKGYK